MMLFPNQKVGGRDMQKVWENKIALLPSSVIIQYRIASKYLILQELGSYYLTKGVSSLIII